MITREQATEMLAILSSEFRVKPPTLAWRPSARRGIYHTRTRVISMGPNTRGEATVLHEFAHHLDAMTNRPRYSKSRYEHLYTFSRGKQAFHDVPFRAALVRVATAWYGDPAKYPWVSEYKAVKQWWGKRVNAAIRVQDNHPTEQTSKSTLKEPDSKSHATSKSGDSMKGTG